MPMIIKNNVRYCSTGGDAESIVYNNTESGMEATNMQDAIDELNSNLTNTACNMRYNSETDMIEICFNEEWIEWQIANLLDFKIYTNGYQNKTLTTDYSTNWDRSQASVQLSGEYIKFTANANSNALIGTNESIDVTNFNKIYVEYATDSNSTKKIQSYDISSTNGNKYIWVRLVDYNGKIFGIGTSDSKTDNGKYYEFSTNSVTYVYRIWLE